MQVQFEQHYTRIVDFLSFYFLNLKLCKLLQLNSFFSASILERQTHARFAIKHWKLQSLRIT